MNEHILQVLNNNNAIEDKLKLQDNRTTLDTLSQIDKMGTYTPGERESTNVIDRRTPQPTWHYKMHENDERLPLGEIILRYLLQKWVR